MEKLEIIYWIGGSPCSGKSSLAEMLVEKYNFQYYKCDDYFDIHMKIGVERGLPIITQFSQMDAEETWMRPVEIQLDSEIDYYKEELILIMEDLSKYSLDKPVIVEGAAILPEFIESKGISRNRVVYIAPTPEFQLEHYKKREWVKYVLKDCSNPNKAFENWMNRDIAYAKRTMDMAKRNKWNLIVVDGKRSLEENFKLVEQYFELK